MAIVEVGANQAFVESEFGGPVTNQTTAVTVQTSVTRILDSNPEALSANIINLGGQSVFISPDNQPATTHGILLAANGGFLSLNVRDDQLLPALSWYAVAAADASQLYIIRLVRYTIGATTFHLS